MLGSDNNISVLVLVCINWFAGISELQGLLYVAFKGLDDTAYSGAYHYARSGDLVQGFSSCADLVQGFSSCTDLVHGFSSCTDLVQGFSSCANLVQGFSSCADLEQGFSSCTSHFPPPPPTPTSPPPTAWGEKNVLKLIVHLSNFSFNY